MTQTEKTVVNLDVGSIGVAVNSVIPTPSLVVLTRQPGVTKVFSQHILYRETEKKT